ncbi:hypothetical protein K440DRAFT_624970 [Wilcoxina mikolae CBS 423.85]|nr:hypothetical protein K440DRAFT_624970 [Wilcoxina mikolae CBS 423.85]
MTFQTPTKAPRLRSLPQKEPLHTIGDRSVAHTLFTPETEEWVVFSPSVVGDTNTIFSATNHFSLESDVASVVSASSRGLAQNVIFPASFSKRIDTDEEDDESSLDGVETDSLQPFCDYDGPVMLPTHDGFGTFRSLSCVSGSRSLGDSLRIVAALAGSQQNDTHSRIQKWRMEQGHALIDEVERARRWRRRSSSKSHRSGRMVFDCKSDETRRIKVLTDHAAENSQPCLAPVSNPVTKAQTEEVETSKETFWKRVTRSFVRDLFGSDDLLEVICFGDSIPVEVRNNDSPDEEMNRQQDVEKRVFNRIAKELGELLHLYTQHPSGIGAFSTKRRSFHEQAEDGRHKTLQLLSNQRLPGSCAFPNERQHSDSFLNLASDHVSGHQSQISPTMTSRQEEEEEASNEEHWGIEEGSDDLTSPQVQQEYWEQELDLRLVFSFFKSRFYGLTCPAMPMTSTVTPLHHHHPLINRKQTTTHQRTSAPLSKLVSSTASGQGFVGAVKGTTIARRCASHERASGDKRTSESSCRMRGYYWDVSTSVGSKQSGSWVGTGMWAAI